MSSSSLLLSRKIAFAATGVTSLSISSVIFRDLSDFSQWVSKPKRNNLMQTWKIRHELAASTIGSCILNTAFFFTTPGGYASLRLPGPAHGKVLWGGINVASLGMLFLGYGNPELMMRSRNRNAMYVTTCAASKIMKPDEWCIVAKYGKEKHGDDKYYAFPYGQIARPHIAGVDRDERNIPAAIVFCALTGTGIVYEMPDLPDGTPREFFPLTQLENNLVVMEKNTAHIGHQINGVDETLLLQRIGSDTYDDVGHRPSSQDLSELGVEPATEVATWIMPLQYYAKAFPLGRVFINDYKEFPDLKRPVLTIYDRIMDGIFYVAINLFQNQWWGGQFFPTIEHVDDRLPTKTRVWGFNVGDNYVALTKEFVENGKGGNRNMIVGGVPIVASWDSNTESLGIFVRADNKPVHNTVDVNGKVGGKGEHLERVSTVKNGLWWYVWQNFFPTTSVNPEK